MLTSLNMIVQIWEGKSYCKPTYKENYNITQLFLPIIATKRLPMVTPTNLIIQTQEKE